MNKRLSTLEDVAKEAGVSQQTVSRVLNNPQLVTERTRRKVIQAMTVLDYVPNRSAQLLAGKTLPALGLMTTSLSLHAPSQIAAAVKSHAGEQGYEVSMSMLKDLQLPTIQRVLSEFRAQKITSVLLSLPLEKDDAENLMAANPDMQCLFLDVPPDAAVCHLGFDHKDGTCSSVEHLWQRGHRHFALLAGPEDAVSSRLRLASWRGALQAKGKVDCPTAFGDWSAASGWLKTTELCRCHPEMTALLVANDQMALGAIHALSQTGRRVPQDVSVIGYDDTPDSQYFQPALTTVAQDFDQIGRQAVMHLLQMAQSPAVRIEELLPTRLVVRQSTDIASSSNGGSQQRVIQQLKALIDQL